MSTLSLYSMLKIEFAVLFRTLFEWAGRLNPWNLNLKITRFHIIGPKSEMWSDWTLHQVLFVRRAFKCWRSTIFFQRLSCRCTWLNMSKPFECNVVRFREPADKCAGPIEPRRLFMCHSNPDVCARIITGTIALTFSSSFYSPRLIWRKTFWVEDNDPMDIIRMTISYIHREALVWWSIHLWQHWRPLKMLLP